MTERVEEQLQRDIAGFLYDPYGFVMYAYPWGKEGTFLAKHAGPDEWQKKALIEIGDAMRAAAETGEPVRILRRSGHEIGKTAFIAWIIQWFTSTREHPVGVVTANTKQQLDTKTWRELSKWHDVMIHKHWFTWTATKYYLTAYPNDWFVAATPWSKERSEAFAGTHDKRGVLMIFDESSLIDDKIWEVADGAMDEGSLWLAFGNPTRNTGMFHEAAVGKFRHRWKSARIDSRVSKIANQTRIKQWLEDYGDDSDYVRVRVKGEFPRASSMQYIPSDIVMAAAIRLYNQDMFRKQPKIMGVDVARFGDDQSTMIKRQGLQSWDLKKTRGVDVDVFASLVAQEAKEFVPDAVFVDASGGYGLAVIYKLKQLGFPVIEVQFGGAAADEKSFRNKRAEIWGRMKEWLKSGGAIPDDDELKADLVGPEYSFVNLKGHDVVILEAKEDMKSRGLASPDCGDALAMTFAEHLLSASEQSAAASMGGVAPAIGDPNGDVDPTRFIREAAQRLHKRR